MSIHPYVLQNGEIREAAAPSLFAGQLGLLSGWGVFTTIRVVDGALFAWERHWARLSRDAKLLNVAMPGDAAAIERSLRKLIEKNEALNCTLRLVAVRNGGGLWEGPSSGFPSDVIGLTAASKRWPESVRLGIQPHGRYAASDFTRAKVISWAHNLRWAERAQEQGFDEVILLNEFGRVTELTSANIFAAFGNEVATPPTSEGCLPGVTREVLLEMAPVEGISVVERTLALDDLYRADGVFITSTTRGLLRVREIDGRAVGRATSGDNAFERLLRGFDSYVMNDIAGRTLVSGRAEV